MKPPGEGSDFGEFRDMTRVQGYINSYRTSPEASLMHLQQKVQNL